MDLNLSRSRGGEGGTERAKRRGRITEERRGEAKEDRGEGAGILGHIVAQKEKNKRVLENFHYRDQD